MRLFKEGLIKYLLVFCSLVSIFTTVGIILVLAFETIEFFKVVPLREFLLDTEWTPLFYEKHFGIWPLLLGTVLTSAIAIVVALPFGIFAAIYLSEFASERVRKIVKPALELLAGVPTVIYGYFALLIVTPFLQNVIPNLSGFNSISPGIVMGIMIIPLISSLSEDAIYAVPQGLREGAYALGGRKLPTIFRVVIPTASSGIVAAVTLAISRALGETMIVTIAAGQQPRFTLDPRVPIETMTAFIVQVGLGDAPTGTLEYKTLFVVGSMLFLMTFVMNMWSQRLKGRFQQEI
ncbi:MAG: phosphate ABC transporter permease subunit PstC [Deltaproteobacteria bacterium RIFCSPHIGHO2_12_FULL_43_9]|nr:MAG: phosphate ABC transporter permease subunit PstC [Deltaproteobacteria bacterium RIFCSPHIGHO2_12_FULL_43_9]